MSQSQPEVIIFAGAPTASQLHESSCTINSLDNALSRFLGLGEDGSGEASHLVASHATWRSLPLLRTQLHTGFTQSHDVNYSIVDGHSGFFTTADAALEDQSRPLGSDDEQDLLTQFCEQSLAAHHSLPSSDLDSMETSFMTTPSTGADVSTASAMQPPPPQPPPIAAHLSDLEDIPSASRIVALNPQTVTLNLIVGIISIAQPRTVTTRWGKTMSLVEVLVGDETRSGFGVTFWLTDDGSTDANQQLSSMGRQDVVLIQNVGLHVFRNKVYGQSLRRGMTKISVLWRKDGSGLYSTRDLNKRRSKQPQIDKTRLVKDWVLQFVGPDPRMKTRTSALKSWDKPPDDTQ